MLRLVLFVVLFQLSSTILLTKCPDGTINPPSGLPGSCYLFVNQSKTFDAAEKYCIQNGGHLTKLTDGFTDIFLDSQSHQYFPNSNSYWIGGKVINYLSSNIWIWTDNTLMGYTNWIDPIDASSVPPPGYCISVNVNQDRWTISNCNQTKPFICQIPEMIRDFRNPCDEGWLFNNETQYCYRHYSHIRSVDFMSAEKWCKSEGGHLASIHSEAENTFVSRLTASASNCGYGIWIGTSSNESGILSWTDGTPVDYNNVWDTTSNYTDYCFPLLPDGNGYSDSVMKWGYSNCNDLLDRYLCKKLPSYQFN